MLIIVLFPVLHAPKNNTSEWLKNADAADTISDTTGLHNIVNVKGSETYKDNGDGTVTWDAKGADIYYQGTTEKELPVKMKISYT